FHRGTFAGKGCWHFRAVYPCIEPNLLRRLSWRNKVETNKASLRKAAKRPARPGARAARNQAEASRRVPSAPARPVARVAAVRISNSGSFKIPGFKIPLSPTQWATPQGVAFCSENRCSIPELLNGVFRF